MTVCGQMDPRTSDPCTMIIDRTRYYHRDGDGLHRNDRTLQEHCGRDRAGGDETLCMLRMHRVRHDTTFQIHSPGKICISRACQHVRKEGDSGWSPTAIPGTVYTLRRDTSATKRHTSPTGRNTAAEHHHAAILVIPMIQHLVIPMITMVWHLVIPMVQHLMIPMVIARDNTNGMALGVIPVIWHDWQGQREGSAQRQLQM